MMQSLLQKPSTATGSIGESALAMATRARVESATKTRTKRNRFIGGSFRPHIRGERTSSSLSRAVDESGTHGTSPRSRTRSPPGLQHGADVRRKSTLSGYTRAERAANDLRLHIGK